MFFFPTSNCPRKKYVLGIFAILWQLTQGFIRKTTPVRLHGGELRKFCSSSHTSSVERRTVLAAAGAGIFGGALGGDPLAAFGFGGAPKVKPTNEVVKVVDGIRQKRLGGGEIFVSEVGLGTQRWVSTDFNAPSKEDCFQFMNRAILESGVNLIDTAEQYPIPSGPRNPEGLVEEVIGKWLAQDKGRRSKVVIASKITGGSNVTKRNIRKDCEESLKRLGTDYMDLYLLHWPARYTPQANWGQSLGYKYEAEQYPWYKNAASFEDIAEAMGALVKEGKIRGWGMCNDNAFGLAAQAEIAKRMNVEPPCVMQGDFSIINRRSEENGLFEASSPIHENAGFLGYNALAGGVLTGKYLDAPAAVDLPSRDQYIKQAKSPRGRMDEYGWGSTLYRYRSGPAIEAALAYRDLAKKNNMSLTELSLRWCKERQGLTSTLLGFTSMAQLEEDLKYFQNSKRLSSELMWEVDRIHMRNRLPIFSSYQVGADWDGEGQIGEPIP
mmetsp:Transcript_15171/g.20030  ORF Transcript_15171/g.20030 Transcript_15171/m.20030 type:complete len:495 (-) Transcript_15171:162-1646(-)